MEGGHPLFTHVTRQALSIVILPGQIKSTSTREGRGARVERSLNTRRDGMVANECRHRCAARLSTGIYFFYQMRCHMHLLTYVPCRCVSRFLSRGPLFDVGRKAKSSIPPFPLNLPRLYRYHTHCIPLAANNYYFFLSLTSFWFLNFP